MARVRMVTRTVEVTVAEVMTLNVVTAEVQITKYELTGKLIDDASILKAVAKLLEGTDVKAVHVQETSIKEVLYGMLEADFIKLAKELPPRTVQETEDTEAE